MIQQHKKFMDLQKAIGVEKNHIEEVHQIKICADSLSALIQAGKEYQENFQQRKEIEEAELEKEITEQKRKMGKGATEI